MKVKKKKCWCHLLWADVFSFFVTRKYQKLQKICEIVNIEEENLPNFWTIWGITMKFSGKMWLMIIMIILKITKNQNFNISLKNAFLKNHWGRVKLTFSGLRLSSDEHKTTLLNWTTFQKQPFADVLQSRYS